MNQNEVTVVNLLLSGSVADTSAMAATTLHEKVMSGLAVSADDVDKFMPLLKAMYHCGVTPQVLQWVMILDVKVHGFVEQKLGLILKAGNFTCRLTELLLKLALCRLGICGPISGQPKQNIFRNTENEIRPFKNPNIQPKHFISSETVNFGRNTIKMGQNFRLAILAEISVSAEIPKQPI